MKRIFTGLALAVVLTLGVSASAQFKPFEELSVEGQNQLTADWLFQADGNPTPARVADEIKWATEAADRISKLEGAPNLDAYKTQLKDLSGSIAGCKNIKQLYLDVRKVKRQIMFSNPLVDFDSILLIDNPYPNGKPGDATNEWGHEARHRNGYMAVDGGRMLIVGPNPGDVKKDVLEGKVGSFWRPDLSYDAKEILFCFKPEGDRSFHLYKVNVDGTDFRQLTQGDYDDLDPVYTPDGMITFCSSRQHSYVRCMPMTHSYAVTRCDGDGKNIYVVSANGEPEYMPSVLPDGRVIFTRWEYTDKALWRVQSLWTMNPDGTNTQTFWGNQSVWPDVLTEARAIPGSNKVVFTAVGHHSWFDGTIGYIDQSKGLNYPDGCERVMQDVGWAEVGGPGWPPTTGPGPNDNLPPYDYHSAGKYYAYKAPFPLSEEYMLVSAREGTWIYNGPHNNWYFNLYLQDVYGNKELVFEGKYNAWYALPLKERQQPVVKPDLVDWPEIGKGLKPANGYLYSNNVFDNAPEILKGNGKYIRVIQMDPKTYTTWHKTVQHDGPAVSVFQAEGVKRILGTVKIEEDGSIFFEVPSGQSFYFEMLDADMRAIHVMRSFTNVMPGEVRGCFGCHESNLATKGNQPSKGMNMAMKKGPQKLVEPSWGTGESISYMRFVQPVLDKYCAECHQKEGTDAFAKLNMTCRPSRKGWWGNVQSRPDDVSPFCEPYLTLVGGDCGWGSSKPKNELGVPKNLAGLFVVEGYNMNDPKNLITLPPYSAWTPVSTLYHNACSGEHHDVKVTGEDKERLMAWIDCNGPYLGDEEIRNMYDPDTWTVKNIPPVRPRIATAPVINRFDISQEGDSNANCKPLKLLADVRAHEYGPANFTILSAVYGAGDKTVDVTDRVRASFKGYRMITEIVKYNDSFGDPAQNVVKTLTIKAKDNDTNQERTWEFKEDEQILMK